MARDLFSRAGWLAASLVVGALALEGTVRLDDWAQHGVPFTARATSLGELIVRDSLGLHARAGGQFRQFRINRAGFRGPEVDLSMPGQLRIVTAGASETFGLYEPAGKEWPRQLEDSLHTSCGDRRAVVLNAAFAGMALPTVRQDYERRLRPLQPQLVVYYPTPMQYLEAAELPRAAAVSAAPPAPLSPWRLRTVPRFRDAVKRAVPEPLLDVLRQLDTKRQLSAAGTKAKAEAEPERLEAFDRDLRGLVGSYRAGGSAPVLVIHRHRFRDTSSAADRRLLRAWERFYPRYTAGALLAFDDSAAARMRRIAADSGIAVVDPLPGLEPVRDSAFADFSHFTARGSAVMAGAVAGAVRPLVCPAP
jgi:lysophospholipase L1-like esterase